MAFQIPFPIPAAGYALNSKLRINLDFISSAINDIILGTSPFDVVTIGTPNSITGLLQFYNSTNNHVISFAPGVTSADSAFTLPTGFPSASRKFLASTTAGVMSWSTISDVASYTGNYLIYLDASSVIQELAPGTSNRVLRNTTPPKYVDLLGTTNQVTVTPNTNDYTFSLPQSINTTANVQFNQLLVDGGTATNPGLGVIFSGASTNTGLFSSSGTNLSITVAGALRGSWDNTGNYTAIGSITSPTYRATTSYTLSTGSSGIITIQADGASGGTYTLTMPVDDGTPSQVLTTDGSGVLSWTTPSGTGANTALSNLASVAINTSLISDTDVTDDLGSSSKKWRDIYCRGIVGTTTNNNAQTGSIGETTQADALTLTNITNSNTFQNITSISLTAGDWLVTGKAIFAQNGATMTRIRAAISTNSGNTTTDQVQGDNQHEAAEPNGVRNSSIVIPNFRISISSTTTVYWKASSTFSAGNPQVAGTIIAVRIR